MRIAIVHELLIKMGGAERVAKVFAEMFPEAPIFTLLYDEKKCGHDFPQERVIASSLQKYYNLGVPLSLLRTRMAQTIEEFDFSAYDLVISSSSAFAHGVLTDIHTKHLCYCHSPMRYVWDYFHEIPREHHFGAFRRHLFENYAHKLRLWDKVAADRPEKVIANSHTVQKRICKFWQREAKVIFPPVNITRFTPSKHHEDYFLIVSALQPFKRIDLAVKTFAKIPKHRLVIIGDGDARSYLEEIATSNVEFLGRKNDEIVSEYLQNCRALIFPGLEDFGITPVETMACGKPVIAFDGGGVKESVIDGKTGVFFEQQTEESLLEALTRFFEIEDDFDAKKIRARAEDFAEEKFKAAIAAEIEELMR